MDDLPHQHYVEAAESPFQYMIEYPKGRLLVTPDSESSLHSALEQSVRLGIPLQSFSQAVICWLKQPNKFIPVRHDFQTLTSTVRMKRIEGKYYHVGYAELLPTPEHAAFAEKIQSRNNSWLFSNNFPVVAQLWDAARDAGRIYVYYEDSGSLFPREYNERILEDNKNALFGKSNNGNALGNYLVELLLNTDVPVFLAETKRSIYDSRLELGNTVVEPVSFHAISSVSEVTWSDNSAIVRWIREVSFEELQQRGAVSIAEIQHDAGRISVSDDSKGRISRS